MVSARRNSRCSEECGTKYCEFDFHIPSLLLRDTVIVEQMVEIACGGLVIGVSGMNQDQLCFLIGPEFKAIGTDQCPDLDRLIVSDAAAFG